MGIIACHVGKSKHNFARFAEVIQHLNGAI